MNLEKLYEQYGRLLIQAEIVNNQVNNVKSQIVEAERNRNKVTPPPIKENTDGDAAS